MYLKKVIIAIIFSCTALSQTTKILTSQPQYIIQMRDSIYYVLNYKLYKCDIKFTSITMDSRYSRALGVCKSKNSIYIADGDPWKSFLFKDNKLIRIFDSEILDIQCFNDSILFVNTVVGLYKCINDTSWKYYFFRYKSVKIFQVNDGFLFEPSGDGLYTDINLSLPLPIELTSFTLQSYSNYVKLEWNTASESDNAGFEVQRKIYNSDWSTISYIAGNGTSFNSHDYVYIDNDVCTNLYTYRLKQIDRSGKFIYSNEKNISLNINNPIFIYPNPCRDVLVIDTKEPINTIIYNSIGQKLSEVYVESKLNLDFKKYATGTYYISIRASNSTKTIKIQCLR